MLFSLILSIVISFSSPVGYDISLAGNFGEPRPHHYHGGIDIKTERVVNRAVRSIGSGYVSRIVVDKYGFGKAIYIKHPQGYTSMFCHLNGFAPQIEKVLRKWQKIKKCGSIDISLLPNECPVAEGQLIAISGNTGASHAPHIHMEMYDDETGDMIDPLIFMGRYIKDTTPPQAISFMAYPQKGEGLFSGSDSKRSFPSSSLTADGRKTFMAWGKVGFGIWAHDYMDNTYNHLGVCTTRLYVDERLVAETIVDRIPQDKNRMVDYCGDYEHYRRTGVWYMKMFAEPGNTWPMYATDANRGYVIFDEPRDYNIRFVVTDFWNNSREYRFVVKGVPIDIPPNTHVSQLRRLFCNRVNNVFLPDAQLTVRPGSVTRDLTLSPYVDTQPDKLSDRYAFATTSLPLVRSARIAIKCRKDVKDSSKLYISNSHGASRYYGGIYKDGWVIGEIRDIGDSYEIKYDDTPPIVNPVASQAWTANGMLRFRVTDNASGLSRCYGYIDDEPIVFEGNLQDGNFRCDLRKNTVRMGKHRLLKFIAVDNKNNKETYTTTIKY